ncbi:MAG: rcc01693 family protein [Pseudomonadota bacterium]
MTAFDWEAVCRLGIGELRLRPEDFWRLTPAELQMMVAPKGIKPLDRPGLSALMARFPDVNVEEDDGGF